MNCRLLPILLVAAVLAAACDRRDNAASASPADTIVGAAQKAIENPGQRKGGCDQLISAEDLKRLLKSTPGEGEAGGLASGKFEWAAIVNRQGELCVVAVATDDPAAAWPGSQAIAKAKAFTANAFSSDVMPMSTARLYTLSLPGHSLWSAANGNPFNPQCLSTPDHVEGIGKVCGGTIAFGGGLPLYRGQTRVGGLGVSGDTPCADHEIAKRIRTAAKLDPPGGAAADDIQYVQADGATIWAHPLCPNTWRNGRKVGDEPSPAG